METIYDFRITAESINGKVYLRCGARRWTKNIAEAYIYRQTAQVALKKAVNRFSEILQNIKLEKASVAC
jgi:hypothetical protein